MQWLVDTWHTYSSVILPILLSIVGFGGSFLIIYIRNMLVKILVNRSENGILINQIKSKVEASASGSDVFNVLEKVNSLIDKVVATDQRTIFLAEMVKIAFDGTGLTPEYKERINSLYNKVVYENEEVAVSYLEDQLKLAKAKIESLERQIETPAKVVEHVKKESKRVRS